ncbi:MAG: hypothetical protein FWD44_10000, partial [Oscillospiraceae bacterium]|nr:hypothetical protein [Oscillospiraceae bacterium]
LGLMKPNGEIIWSRFSVGSDTTKISFNIGDINPNDLALVVAGARAEQVINGQWSFNVAIDDTVILEPGKFIGEYNGLRTEVDVGATHVRITVHNAAKRAIVNDIVFDESPILLHMADGKTIVVQRGGASGDAEIIGIDYFMDFINPGDVVSIEFLGVKIGG